MANSREIVKHRKSVTNIRKITKTMEMIATSRYKKTYSQAMRSQPFTKEISDLVMMLGASTRAEEHPLLRHNDDAETTVLLVLTSNRGLCGGYNGQMMRSALHEISTLEGVGRRVELRVSGKKGIGYFRFIGRAPSSAYTQFGDNLRYADVETLADDLMDRYQRRTIRGVRVVFTKFISTSQYQANVMDLLPFSSHYEPAAGGGSMVQAQEYIFSPSAEEIFAELAPMAVRSALYQCFMDSVVSEQMARMRAMKAATDNAEQMNRMLTRQYNRVRQGQITSELLDILGGVEALK